MSIPVYCGSLIDRPGGDKADGGLVLHFIVHHRSTIGKLYHLNQTKVLNSYTPKVHDKILCCACGLSRKGVKFTSLTREMLHVTFGSAIGQFGVKLKAALVKHETNIMKACALTLKNI